MPKSASDGSRAGPSGGRDPRGERHPGGWRVRPGPDGRGSPPPAQKRSVWGSGPGLVIIFAILLMINIVVAASLRNPPTQVRIPYSPTFVDDGHIDQ